MINFDAPAILERQNVGYLGNGKYGYTSVDQIFVGHCRKLSTVSITSRNERGPATEY